jgi:gliding motility-associated-like protein
MKIKMKQHFEETIKDLVSNHEVPYEIGAWEKFLSNSITSTPFYKSKWIMAAGLVAIIVISILSYSLTDKNAESDSLLQITRLLNETKPDNSSIKTVELKLDTTTKLNFEDIKSSTVDYPIDKSDRISKHREENLTSKTKISQIRSNDGPETKPSIDKPTLSTQKKPENKDLSIIDESEMESADFFLETKVCKGNTVNLIAKENNRELMYLWSINNNEFLKGNNTSFVASDPGLNSIKLSIKNSEGKIISSHSSTINVIELPEATISVKNEEFEIVNNHKFKLSSTSNNSVKWDLGDGTTSNKTSLNHTYKQGGNYTVTANLTNEDGCTAIETKKIDVKGLYNIRTDYGFSPNGDNINDNFLPLELKTLDVRFTMNIYSRNGQIIYTTNSIEQPWNGIMQDGSRSPFGSYVWVLTLTNENGIHEVYKGTITNVSN